MPPIYPARSDGTKAQQFLHRARMFRAAASEPGLPDYRNGEPFWPKYALLTHAIELSLKAFFHYSIDTGKPSPAKEPDNHDLAGWYRLAVGYGLRDEPEIAENITLLNELHFGHFTRYPQHRTKPIPDASIIADSTVDHLIFILTQIINPR
jgi:hypothetical protein